jgi:hypothetical protein
MATLTTLATAEACWCCGQERPAQELVHLGNHPEVALCLRCAHFVHRLARRREDEVRPSPAARMRGRLWAVRAYVVQKRLHQRPVIGKALRWLGNRLP